jgi:hypothetical protein
MSTGWRILRDAILVAIGCFMLIHETLIAPEPRQLIVAAGFGLLGVPVVLARLERRREE